MQLSFSSKHFATLFHSVANSLKIKVQPMVSELIQTWPGVSGHCWFSWLCFWQWGKWGKLIGHEKKSFGKSVTLFLFPWQVDIWQQTLSLRPQWIPSVLLPVIYSYQELNTVSIPEWGRSPGEGSGNPLQNSCLGNPMDRGAWWTTVHGVAKSQTQLATKTTTNCYP